MSKGKTTSSTAVDPKQMAMFEDLYGKGKSIFNTPFTPFTGEGVAGFTPDQLFIQDQARGMFDESFGLNPRQQLNNLASQDAPSLLSADLEAYQNPFRQQVIDNTLGDLDRARQIQLQSDQDAAIGRGAFGGSRSALLESETNKNFADVAGRTAGNLRQSGFNNAANLALNDRNFRAGLFGNQLADQYRGLGLLSGIGRQQQGLGQAGLDANYGEFMRGINYGPKQLSLLRSSVFGGTPGETRTSSTNLGTIDRLGDAINSYQQVAGLFEK